MKLSLDQCREIVHEASRPFYRGHIDIVSGVLVEAIGVPAALGELCRIERGPGQDPIDAEVVGFRGSSTLLMPHGDLSGIGSQGANRAVLTARKLGAAVQRRAEAIDHSAEEGIRGLDREGAAEGVDGLPGPDPGEVPVGHEEGR